MRPHLPNLSRTLKKASKSSGPAPTMFSLVVIEIVIIFLGLRQDSSPEKPAAKSSQKEGRVLDETKKQPILIIDQV